MEISNGFWLQETPVTNEQFGKFVNEMSERSLGLYLNLPDGDALMLGFGCVGQKAHESGEMPDGILLDDIPELLNRVQEIVNVGSREGLETHLESISDLLESNQNLLASLKFLLSIPETETFEQLNSLKQYLQIENAVPRNWEPQKNFDHPQQPAVGRHSSNAADEYGINWYQALAYARWRYGVKGTLPTEAQWEWSARGADNLSYATANGQLVGNGVQYNQVTTARVDRADAPRGPFGHRDLTGNVWEWTRSIYGTYAEQSSLDPLGAMQSLEGMIKVLRGASWYDFDPRLLRAACRDYGTPVDRGNNIGFRAVALPQD